MKETEALEKFCKEVTSRFKKEVKAIWLLTAEKNEDIILTILLDDLNAGRLKRFVIRKFVKRIERKILKENSIVIHTGFYNLSEYFEKVMKGSLVIFSEIKNAQPLYDPTGFFTPLKPLAEEGEIMGTKESLIKLIGNVKMRFNKIEVLKIEILEKLYTAVVNAGQAPLIAANCPVPAQKEITKCLKKHFVNEKYSLSLDYLEMCDDVIRAFKDFEHKRRCDISGRELNELSRKSKAFISKMERLVLLIHKED